MYKSLMVKLKSFLIYIFVNISFCIYLFIFDNEINKMYSSDYQFGFVKNIEIFEYYYYIKYFFVFYGSFIMDNDFYKINCKYFLLKIYLSLFNSILLILLYLILKEMILYRLMLFQNNYLILELIFVLLILPIFSIFLTKLSYYVLINYNLISIKQCNFNIYIFMKLKSILSYMKYPVLGHMIYIFICLVIGWLSEYNKSFIFLEKNIVLKNNQSDYLIPYYFFSLLTSIPACVSFFIIKKVL